MKTLTLFYHTSNLTSVEIKSLIEDINTKDIQSLNDPDSLLRDKANFIYHGIDVEANKLNLNDRIATQKGITSPQILITSPALNEEGESIESIITIEDIENYNAYGNLEALIQ